MSSELDDIFYWHEIIQKYGVLTLAQKLQKNSDFQYKHELFVRNFLQQYGHSAISRDELDQLELKQYLKKLSEKMI